MVILSPPQSCIKNNYFTTFQKSLLLFFISFSFFACEKNDEEINTPAALTEQVNFNGLEIEILAIVNQHRESIGLKKLTPLAPAYYEAINHTNYMISQGKISHDNFESRRIKLMATTAAKVVAENVAAGFPTAQEVVNGWLKSENHRINIENPSVQYMGVSVQQNSNNVNYYTQIFIGK